MSDYEPLSEEELTTRVRGAYPAIEELFPHPKDRISFGLSLIISMIIEIKKQDIGVAQLVFDYTKTAIDGAAILMFDDTEKGKPN